MHNHNENIKLNFFYEVHFKINKCKSPLEIVENLQILKEYQTSVYWLRGLKYRMYVSWIWDLYARWTFKIIIAFEKQIPASSINVLFKTNIEDNKAQILSSRWIWYKEEKNNAKKCFTDKDWYIKEKNPVWMTEIIKWHDKRSKICCPIEAFQKVGILLDEKMKKQIENKKDKEKRVIGEFILFPNKKKKVVSWWVFYITIKKVSSNLTTTYKARLSKEKPKPFL